MLPEKETYTKWFSLTGGQMEHYRDVVDRFLDLELLAQETGSSAFIYKIFSALQQAVSGQRILSSPLEELRREPFFADPEDNPRIKALFDVMEEIGAEKCIIWCRFSEEIDNVMSVLCRHGLSCVSFDGRTPQRKRQENLEAFSGDVQYFVANKTCAGYGLNLQFCRNAIYYNNDWDWATRAQSEDRIHRIGQEKKVRLYDLAAESTIDERILDCLTRKGSMVESFKRAVKDRNLTDWLTLKAEIDLTDVGDGGVAKKSVSDKNG